MQDLNKRESILAFFLSEIQKGTDLLASFYASLIFVIPHYISRINLNDII